MTNPTLQQRIATLENNLIKGKDIAPLPTFVYYTLGRDSEQKKQLDIDKAFIEYKERHADNELVQSFRTVDDLMSYVENNDEAKSTIISIVFEDMRKKRPHISPSKPSYDAETVLDLSKVSEQQSLTDYLDQQAEDLGKHLDNLPNDIQNTLDEWGRA